MSKPNYANHTFAPWRVVGDKRVVAPESTWKKPLSWGREAKAGVRQRVLVNVDVFDDWRGPLWDGLGNRLHRITDGRPGLVGGTTKSTHWYSESPCDDSPEPWLTMADVRNRLFGLIDSTPNLDWLLVTERPQNIAAMMPHDWVGVVDKVGIGYTKYAHHPPRNLWLGVRITDQATADERIPHLLRVPAKVRFVDAVLRGPVDLSRWLKQSHCQRCLTYFLDVMDCEKCPMCGETNAIRHPRSQLDWLTVSGESGQHARPMHPDWVRSLRNQCTAAGVPFWFGGWGEWWPYSQRNEPSDDRSFSYRTDDSSQCFLLDKDGKSHGSPWSGWLKDVPNAVAMCRCGKAASGRTLDGQEWKEVPA